MRAEEVVLAAEPRTGPDAARDHASLHEQLTARRESAERRRRESAQTRERAEREESEWGEQVARYDQMLATLGRPVDRS